MSFYSKGIVRTNPDHTSLHTPVTFLEVNVRCTNIRSSYINTKQFIHVMPIISHISLDHGVCYHLNYNVERSFWQLNRKTSLEFMVCTALDLKIRFSRISSLGLKPFWFLISRSFFVVRPQFILIVFYLCHCLNKECSLQSHQYIWDTCPSLTRGFLHRASHADPF
jgi:hypothetical protein